MTSPLRFAILGFGLHASRRLVPAFPACRSAKLVGLWRRNQEEARKNAAEHNIPIVFATREELCASPDVDAVFITSPDAMHLDDSLLAIRHGKAVLCEKPLAMNAADSRIIASAAAEAGVFFGVAQNFRFNRSLEWMREQILAGAIGTPQLAHLEFCYPAINSARKWITDSALATGGPIADVGVHCIDALRFLIDQDVLSISTLAATDEYSADVEAIATMQLAMSGGTFANVTTSGRAPYRTLVEIEGSNGLLVSENGFSVDRPVEVTLRRGGEVVETRTIDNGDGYTRMLDAFADAASGKGSFSPTGKDAIHNMLALDAAYASVSSGNRTLLKG